MAGLGKGLERARVVHRSRSDIAQGTEPFSLACMLPRAREPFIPLSLLVPLHASPILLEVNSIQRGVRGVPHHGKGDPETAQRQK